MTEANLDETELEPEANDPLEQLADAWLTGQQAELDILQLKTAQLDEVLQQLISASGGFEPAKLLVFSDLAPADAERVRRDRRLIPAVRREAVIRYLVDLSDEEVDVLIGALLRIALQDSEAIIRTLAIEGLWEETENDLIGPFIQLMLNDEEIRVRAAAAQALGPFVLAGELDEIDAALSMRAEEALLSVLLRPDEPLEVRSRALESIAYSGEVGIRQLIEDAYYDPTEEMRVSSLIAMGRSADIRWRGLVRAELQNPSPLMRSEAAIACGDLEATAARRELMGLLGDDEQLVRLAAIIALGQIGGKEACDALRAMRESDDPVEVEAADLALEEMLFAQEDAEIALLDEEQILEEWEEPWDELYDADDDDDMGSYDDD